MNKLLVIDTQQLLTSALLIGHGMCQKLNTFQSKLGRADFDR